ncbi:hypothetical protein M413DRAFT_239152 [Hebeloma cylindrosporum]|uniref:DUF6818 domain-containing protein n=1 Tax=Hebeloma cylindrosporum TaxID=76867 RepID=A0A0C3BQH2_HEBCY|nr:hypothetical protein M413DRAFT_239152 [Hebeloma cylindrosporum h7]
MAQASQQSPTRSPLTPLAGGQPTQSQGRSLAATTPRIIGPGQGAHWRFENYNHTGVGLSLPSTTAQDPYDFRQQMHSYPSHAELPGPSWSGQNGHWPPHPPLPASPDDDLTHGPTIARAIGYSPTAKVAGSRHAKSHDSAPEPTREKRKGKRKRSDTSDDGSAQSEDSDAPRKKQSGHGGRRAGAGNYQEQDLKEMLRLVEKELPMGQRGWKRIHEKYAVWATAKGRPPHEWKLLEGKFKNLVKTKKPTGSGRRPESVTRAKAIDKLINEKAGTRTINDSEYKEEDIGDCDASGHDEPHPSKVHDVVARSDRTQAPLPRRPRVQTTELVSKIAQALDPEAQRIRDEERANRSFQNTQVFTVSQQLRDAQATIEALRTELNTTRDRLHAVDRIRDRLDLELNFERRLSALGGKREPLHSPSSRKNHKYEPDLMRVRGKVRHDEHFPEGGQRTTWITDGSSASDWDNNDHKENHLPSTVDYPQQSFHHASAADIKPQFRKYSSTFNSYQPAASSPSKLVLGSPVL